MLTRYWIEFAGLPSFSMPGLGCGVTAESEEAALKLVRDLVFNGGDAEPSNIIHNVDISTLDEGHVRPNMGNPILRGIWFPQGYSN